MDFTQEETYRLTRLPVQLAHTLTPEAYRSTEYFEIESERVFATSWVCVGYTSQVAEPGDTMVASVGDQPIFVVRDRQGSLRAFYNVCRHRGSQLVAGDGKHEVIRCPYHAWGYSLDGKLLGTPYFKGLDVPEAERRFYDTSEVKEFCKEDYGLLPVRVEAWGCFVFVNLDPRRGPWPSGWATCPSATLAIRWQSSAGQAPGFEIKANWKLIAENFMEYYHLPWVHPELTTVSGVNEHHRQQGPGMYTGMCTSPLTRNPDTALWRRCRRCRAWTRPRPRALTGSSSFPTWRSSCCRTTFSRCCSARRRRQTVESADCWCIPRRCRRSRRAKNSTRSSPTGTWSTARTSPPSSACSGHPGAGRTRAAGCASASRSRSTVFRTW